jgi:hypothetical protein
VDLSGAALVFNFERIKGDFRERGYVASDKPQSFSAFGFSADGSYLSLADYFADVVFRCGYQQTGDPTANNIRSPYTPYLALGPVRPPGKAATAKH